MQEKLLREFERHKRAKLKNKIHDLLLMSLMLVIVFSFVFWPH